MLRGFCQKKRDNIPDRKVIRWCWIRWKCIHLRLQIWKLGRKMRRNYERNHLVHLPKARENPDIWKVE